jgi:outer membrane receptor for Fe3+-dicitrate
MLWVTSSSSVEFEGGRMDSYILVNARVSYTFKADTMRVKAFAQAFNLLDHDHREHPEGDLYGLLASAGVEVQW